MTAPLEVSDYSTSIRILRFTEVSRKAVDLFADSITDAQNEGVSNITGILVDSRVGTQPIKYTFSKMRQTFSTAFSDQHPFLYVAIVIGDSVFISLCLIFVKSLSLRNVEFRFFEEKDYDSALTWLESTTQKTISKN